jgi:rhamnulose-1-phosphate aldolase
MKQTFHSFIDRFAQTANDIWLKGWAEANAGNISLRLDDSLLPPKNSRRSSKWQPTGPPAQSGRRAGREFPQIAGDCFLISAAGSFLKNFKLSPDENLGVIQIDSEGSNYRVLWGFARNGAPTSELLTHLYIHSVRKKISNGKDKAVIHAHCPALSALTFILPLDDARLTKLLWQMHAECILAFPEGVGFIPWQMPGSSALAEKTAEKLKNFHAVLWQFHGIIAAGPDLDKTLGLIETIEKTCEIYIKAISAGRIKNKLSKKQLLKIADHFRLKPNQKILSQIK